MRRSRSIRGFTLVEVIVSMSLGMAVMAAVFSTYLYLGKNLTRLSYQSMLERQSRKIIKTIAADVQNAKAVASASSTALALTVFNTDKSKGNTDITAGPVATFTVTYSYNTATGALTRDPGTGGGAVPLTFDIGDVNVRVPVTMPSFSFRYATTTGDDPSSQFSPGTVTAISVKQVAVRFALQAGDTAIHGQQGTLATFALASSWMLLLNHNLPDGT